MKNTYLVCPLIVLCHGSVYFSKRELPVFFFFFVLFRCVYTPFFIHLLYCHSISLSLFTYLPSVIKPCNSHKSMLTVLLDSSTLVIASWRSRGTVCFQIQSAVQWGVLLLTVTVPQALDGHIGAESRRDFFFFFFLEWPCVFISFVYWFLFCFLFCVQQ